MTGKPISPLRQRMIEDMTVSSFDPRMQSHYIRAVKKLTAFLAARPIRRMRRIYAASSSISDRPACRRQPSMPRFRRCGSPSRSH